MKLLAGIQTFFLLLTFVSAQDNIFVTVFNSNGGGSDIMKISRKTGLEIAGTRFPIRSTSGNLLRMSGLAFDASDWKLPGTIYGITSNDSPFEKNTLFSIDSSTGTATAIGPLGNVNFSDLAINDRDELYTWFNGVSNDQFKLAAIDLKTGAATIFGDSGITDNIISMDFLRTEDTKIHVVSEESEYFTIDIGSGIATKVGDLIGAETCGPTGAVDPDPATPTLWCPLPVVGINSPIERINLSTLRPITTTGSELTTNVGQIDTIAFGFKTTQAPSALPSALPSASPSSMPSSMPSHFPSKAPSAAPSAAPSGMPSAQPSSMPTSSPSEGPSHIPSHMPSGAPSSAPSELPSASPSIAPSQSSGIPSTMPTAQPSHIPSHMPTGMPSASPFAQPSESPSAPPTTSVMPSSMPVPAPSGAPSSAPSPNSNLCNSNDCSTFLGFLNGAELHSEIFGLCVTTCTWEPLEGIYKLFGWECGPCP